MVKAPSSTGKVPLILINLSMEEASGIAGVGVKSVNISRNTKCEGSLLGHY